jgi:hypothetical protein
MASEKMAALGFRAHMGWVAAVGVTLNAGAPRLVHSSIVKTAADGDRIAKEPYHVAAGWDGLNRVPPHPDPKAAIAEGRKAQARLATEAIADIVRALEAQKLKTVAGAVLATRAWLGHDLAGILGSHAHVHVYEGEAVRDAVRAGLKANKITAQDVGEKSLYAVAAKALKQSEARLKTTLTALRGGASGPWRQDQKLAALAAWLLLAARRA